MKKAGLLIFAFFLLTLCSCSDYNELNMQELVSFAGIDFSEGEVSVIIVCDGAEEKRTVHTSQGQSFFEAVREMSGRSDKKMYWGHTEALVFGEEALSETFPQTLDAVLRARDVYLDIVPIVAKGTTAAEVLSKNEGKGLEAFVNEENSRQFKAYPLWKFLRVRDLFGVCIIPTVEYDSRGLIMSGGAVLSEKGVVGYLSGEEILMHSLLTEKGAGGYLPTITAEEGLEVSFEILANDIKRKKTEDGYVISQRITLSPAEVKGNMNDEQMRENAKSVLTKKYNELILRVKEENLGNIFQLSDAEKHAKISVDVDVRISNVFGGR